MAIIVFNMVDGIVWYIGIGIAITTTSTTGSTPYAAMTTAWT